MLILVVNQYHYEAKDVYFLRHQVVLYVSDVANRQRSCVTAVMKQRVS